MPAMPSFPTSGSPTIAALRQQLERLLPQTAAPAKAAASEASHSVVTWATENAPLLLDAVLALLRRRQTAAALPPPPPPRRRGIVRPLLLIGLGACLAYGISRAMASQTRTSAPHQRT